MCAARTPREVTRLCILVFGLNNARIFTCASKFEFLCVTYTLWYIVLYKRVLVVVLTIAAALLPHKNPIYLCTLCVLGWEQRRRFVFFPVSLLFFFFFFCLHIYIFFGYHKIRIWWLIKVFTTACYRMRWLANVGSARATTTSRILCINSWCIRYVQRVSDDGIVYFLYMTVLLHSDLSINWTFHSHTHTHTVWREIINTTTKIKKKHK